MSPLPGFCEMGLIDRLRELLPRGVCGVALDIDGTLTEERRRGSFRISIGAIEAIRRLEDNGVRVMLVTGNSAYVVAGVARYLGASGPHVAENGCIVYQSGVITSVCRSSARPAARLVEDEFSGVVTPSWQNPCRRHDYAFIAREEGAAERIKAFLLSRGLHWVKVSHSGYAIHLRPSDASKGRGLLHALRLAGLSPSCVIAVGDSGMDSEMLDAGIILAAVGNAEEELRQRAHLVLPGQSGESVKILVDTLFEAGLVRREERD